MRRDISTELKELRLHGMAGAWADLTTQEGGAHPGVQTGEWLVSHLLQAEHTQRAFASVRHQMKAGPSSRCTVILQASTLKHPKWIKSWSSN